MSTGAILCGILPLLLFVIVDSFAGLKSALITAIIICILEALFSLYYFGELDSVTIFSFFLVLVLAGTSYYNKSSIYLKFQPVILSAVIGIWFLVTYWLGNPLLVTMMTKYQNQLPASVQGNIKNPLFLQLMAIATQYCGFAFLAHGAVTAYAALKLSNWWWIAIRGLGFYFFFFLAFILATLTLKMQLAS